VGVTSPTPGLSAEFQALQAVVSGRYSLEREIGRGGMGIVFLARDVALERPVAIKLLPPHLASDPERRERFVREARTAAQLLHPNIVPIHAVESHADGIVFFVMAYIAGETVAERVRRAGVMQPDDVMRIMQEMAWALGYAHTRGIVHRDIKPDNILIEHGTNRALLADFGIAHVAESQTLSATGTLVGTAQYMSPEQASAEPLDGRSDVYSLGATAYFALVGASPVEAPSLPAMLAKLLMEEPVPVLNARPQTPPALGSIVMRSIAKSRDARFATADHLASALQEITRTSHAVRPEIRNFIREIHSGALFLLIGGLSMIGSALLILAKVLGPDMWPLVPMIAFFGVIFFAAATVAPIVNLAREGIAREEIDAAVGEAINDLATGAKPLVSPKTQIRMFRVMGILYSLGAAFGGYKYMLFRPMIVPEDRDFFRYWLPIPIFAFGILFGIALLVGARPGQPVPPWLVSRKTAKDGPSSWGLRIVRRMLRSRWMARLFEKQGSPAVASPSALPTATLLVNSVADLVGALPLETQRRLGNVVPVATRLEQLVAGIRQRLVLLDSALAQLPAQSGARAEFEGARSHAAGRLAECVSALETLRTDCLRLSAGLIAVDGITRELDRAAALGAIIDEELKGLRAPS
jgi:hypothetical protein